MSAALHGAIEVLHQPRPSAGFAAVTLEDVKRVAKGSPGSAAEELEQRIDDLDRRLDRLRGQYESFFMGIETRWCSFASALAREEGQEVREALLAEVHLQPRRHQRRGRRRDDVQLLAREEVALALGHALGTDGSPSVLGRYRAGDIRHCISDPTKARSILGFEARRRFEEALPELIAWCREQEATDRFERSLSELSENGLVR